MRLLKTRTAAQSEALLEDATSSLMCTVEEDHGAAPALFEMGAMPTLVELVSSRNEELQVSGVLAGGLLRPGGGGAGGAVPAGPGQGCLSDVRVSRVVSVFQV